MCLVLCMCVCVRVVALINNAAAREAEREREREVASSSIQITQKDSRQQKADGGEIKSARTRQLGAIKGGREWGGRK